MSEGEEEFGEVVTIKHDFEDSYITRLTLKIEEEREADRIRGGDSLCSYTGVICII